MMFNLTESSRSARITKRILVITLLCAIAVNVAGNLGCKKIPKESIRYLLFIDQSASISEDQKGRWGISSEKLLNRLQFGDGIAIFGIHDNSLNSEPIFLADIPKPSSDRPGADELTRLKRELSRIRREAKEAFNIALNPQRRSRATDIFSAIDRIQPDCRGRKTVAVFLSDMFNSTQELDLERVKLTEENYVGHLNKIAANHSWQKGKLQGVTVHCVLNSVGIRQASPLNDRRMLRRFWETAFRGLGAEVETFETHLSN